MSNRLKCWNILCSMPLHYINAICCSEWPSSGSSPSVNSILFWHFSHWIKSLQAPKKTVPFRWPIAHFALCYETRCFDSLQFQLIYSLRFASRNKFLLLSQFFPLLFTLFLSFAHTREDQRDFQRNLQLTIRIFTKCIHRCEWLGRQPNIFLLKN